MPGNEMKNWRIELKPAVKLLKSQQRETNCRQKTAGLTRVEVGAGSRDFLWEPAGADKALQPAENKIINWLGFNGVHYLWVQTLGWEEIYTLVISNLYSVAWNNKSGPSGEWGLPVEKPAGMTSQSGEKKAILDDGGPRVWSPFTHWGWLINTRLLNLIVLDSQVQADFNRNELWAKLAFLTIQKMSLRLYWDTEGPRTGPIRNH